MAQYKKALFTICFLLLALTSLKTQTVQDLEYDLSWFTTKEKWGGKIDKAKKLLQLDPFNSKATAYICRYYAERNIDSVSIFLNHRTQMFPDSVNAYLIRAEFVGYEEAYSNKEEIKKQKLYYLDKGFGLDSTNVHVLYELAKIYYDDFLPKNQFKNTDKLLSGGLIPYSFPELDSIKPQEGIKLQEKIKPLFNNSAENALKYFYFLWNQDVDSRDVFYFPIRQLECHLDIATSNIQLALNNLAEDNFFPSWYFANLPGNWACNDSVDFLFLLEWSRRNGAGLTTRLTDLEEKGLYEQELVQGEEVYRFTWLRSFHHPIVVRIERNADEKVKIYWKVGKGAGGYAPEGIKKSGKKKLGIEEWDKLISLLDELRFDALPNYSYQPMTDGASWTLEKKTFEGHKVHDTNDPSTLFKAACMYLVELTNIKIKEEEKY